MPQSRRPPHRLRDAALFAGCCIAGAALAAALSWWLLLGLAQQRLAATSVDLLARAEALDLEVVDTLAHFDRQPGAFCSDNEFMQLRLAVYATAYVKDILRTRGEFACAASTQAPTRPPQPLPPGATLALADGRVVATSVDLRVLAPGAKAPVVAGRETRVALDPAAFDSAPPGTTIAYVDAAGVQRVYGDALPLQVADWRAGRAVDRDGTLFAPLCVPGRAICVATRQSRAGLLDAQWPLLAASALIGLVAGIAAAIAVLLWWRRRDTVEARLRAAIAHGALDVVYQPVVRVRDGHVVGAEALVRWRDDDGRQVPPTEFIPVAEASGLVGGITLLVMARACADFGPRLRAGAFRVNVNLSAQELGDTVQHERIAGVLSAADVPPSAIGIEITEHSTAERETAAAGTRHLERQGHRLYVDDFGTGYSSLSTLAELRVHELKIDRAFTRTLGDPGAPGLVPEIVAMARRLGLAIVVEGVETDAQAALLRAMGDDLHAQGWLWGQPVPAGAFHARWPAAADAG